MLSSMMNNNSYSTPFGVLFLFLLREQFSVGRIELQQLLYILELRLRVPDVFIDAFQSLRQLGGIAADLNGDALDSVCHAVSPPP